MDLKGKPCSEIWTRSPMEDEPSKIYSLDHQSFTHFISMESHRKWEDSSNLDYRIEIEQPSSRFNQSSEPSCAPASNPEQGYEYHKKWWCPRYSCPYLGCKRNKDHKKFQPLKTILCVKNHYKRTHCDKSYTCSRCNSKKFSVIADLKTHEKHCGRDKWLCSCGTTFSRKDKLFGHVTLFQGHTPALPFEEGKGSSGASDGGDSNEVTNEVGSVGFVFSPSTCGRSATQDIVDSKTGLDDPMAFYSPMNFESCNFGGFNELPKPPYEIPESSLSFLLKGSCNFIPKNGGSSGSDSPEG